MDNLIAETAAYLNILHPDFGKLASRIAVTKLHKETSDKFLDIISNLYNYTENNGNLLIKISSFLGENAALISKEVYDIVCANHEKLQAAIDYKRDWEYDYFGFKTLERAYLLKIRGIISERPQHMLMRVSVGIHMNDIDSAIKTYNLMSDRWFTHATPTLFNSGLPKP
jgi:ribonucleoside-diphosphate reductase alpha chain